MTDKSDLIEQIKLHVGFMKAADNPVSDHYHLKEIKRLFIEQACEAIDIANIGWYDYEDRVATRKIFKQAIRDRFEENEQKEIKQKSNTNDLVRRFFNLTISERRKITQKLGLIENADMKVPEMERYKKAFIDVKEQGLIEQLADEVNKLEKANPSESS